MAERKLFRFNFFRTSLVALIIIGSTGIPKPLAIRSFFEKLPATAAAAINASCPNFSTNSNLICFN